MVAYVVIPGINGSDERHWQSRWESQWGADAVRIAPASWDEPDLRDWVAAVHTAHQAAASRDGQVVLVAHSLGCWAAARWLAETRPGDVVAFLVAPPDTRAPSFPRDEAPTFVDVSARPLPCPGLLVTSDDDPYCDAAASTSFARGWQVRHHSVGDQGHINSGSGVGDWPAGRELLRTLAP